MDGSVSQTEEEGGIGKVGRWVGEGGRGGGFVIHVGGGVDHGLSDIEGGGACSMLVVMFF